MCSSYVILTRGPNIQIYSLAKKGSDIELNICLISVMICHCVPKRIQWGKVLFTRTPCAKYDCPVQTRFTSPEYVYILLTITMNAETIHVSFTDCLGSLINVTDIFSSV